MGMESFFNSNEKEPEIKLIKSVDTKLGTIKLIEETEKGKKYKRAIFGNEILDVTLDEETLRDSLGFEGPDEYFDYIIKKAADFDGDIAQFREKIQNDILLEPAAEPESDFV
jgi:hypothetical protein